MEATNDLENINSDSLLQNSPAVTYVCKAYGDFGALFVTDNVKQQTGYTPEQFINDSSFWVNHIHPDDRNSVINDLTSIFDSLNHSHEYRFLHADGKYRWMRDELKLILDENGEPKQIIGYWIDISRRKNIELELQVSNELLDKTIREQNEALQNKLKELAEKEKLLLQAQKMEAIGQLTGGIAHDFNNTMGVILGFSEMAMGQYANMDDSGKLSEFLGNIISAGKRASYLVKQLLAFSRGEVGEPKNIDPVKYVLDSVELLRPTIPSSIKLDTITKNQNSVINIDPTQFNQIIMNLIINARDAIDNEKGDITIRLGYEKNLKNLCSSCHEEFCGDYVVLEVSDSGSGIDLNNDLGRIFDPFYTTKEIGKGTGMGLSVIHGVIHSNDGHIVVESEIGKGSTFKIYLPRMEKTAEVKEKPKKVAKDINISARVMVVDDEPALCYFYKELLETSGFNVEAFTDSQQAYEYLVSHKDQVDLVLTDQTMPSLTGEELAKNILAMKPGLPIIMCTGHSDVINEERAKYIGIASYLKKPVSSTTMIDTVTSLLEN